MTIQWNEQERIEHLKLWIRDIDAYLQNPPLSLNCGEADRLGDLRAGYQQELRELESSECPDERDICERDKVSGEIMFCEFHYAEQYLPW